MICFIDESAHTTFFQAKLVKELRQRFEMEEGTGKA